MEISEKYRKYLVEIILKDNRYYTVWGTDLGDNDNDKLLVNKKNLLLFYKINTLKTTLFKFKDIFLDKENFENWISEDPFEDPYSTTDLTCLYTFSEKDLRGKKAALEIINSLNLIQDFYIQIKENEKAFNSKLLLDLKDNLYNNHFWKSDNLELPFNAIIIKKIQSALRKIYDDFVKQIEFI